jgi:hypothetical protein
MMRALLAACMLVTAAAPAIAQQSVPEVIRGRVSDDSAHALVATVIVTRGPDRLVQKTESDSAGSYRVRFEQGTGDYLVYVSAPGFVAARRRVQRQGEEHEFVANFTLARDLALLEAVKVTAAKPVRASNAIRPQTPEVGASEKWNDGVNGAIPPSVAGDLAAIANTMSNVTMGANGPSILGAGAESNLNTLNGMGLSVGAIPRAAQTETRVTGATFDPTRGGFSGANIDVRLGAGDRFFQRRNAFLTLDPPSLQFTDAAGRSLGARSGGFRGSVGADGELVRGALTYNVALDVARSASDPATLLAMDPHALASAGVSRDSVARLIALAGPLGLPLTGAGVPGERSHESVSWLGRFDDTRDTLSTRALTSFVGVTHDGALNFGPLTAPSASGERRERTMGAQLTLGAYVGEGRRTLTETRLAASGVSTDVSPYRAIPAANVLVRSDLEGGTPDVTGLTLGGGVYLPAHDRRWTLEGGNETFWNAIGTRHRFKAALWGRADGLRQEGIPNELGTFSFNSLQDFQAGNASTFTRTLSRPPASGSVWNAAAALAHLYAPSRWFNMLYGARVEADGFASAPARNPELEQALGIRTGAAPSRVHVSPRIGFTYTYNRDRDNGSGTNQTPVGRFYRSTTGVLRGGIGEFRDLLRPGILADASAGTGLAGGTSVLSCVGSAVPEVDWTSFASDAASIPTQCLDGSGALAERAPSVSLIDPSYDVPRSWRASLDWNTSVHSLLFRVAGLASYDLSQPGTVDANFAGTQRFTLPGEDGRPVFVSAAAIDPASGAVSASESRRSSTFGRVATRVSDLRGYGGQLTFSVAPDVFKFRGRGSMYGSLSYTLQSTRREFRGFDGAAYGDPRIIEWAPGFNDARHVVVLSGGFTTPKTGTVTMFARAQSGLPFTPIVQGDVNGDGRGGDRAFIPDPAAGSDPVLGGQIASLITNGSSTARECLQQYLGHVAARNGCRGPWTESLNIQWRPPMPNRWGGRVRPSVYLQNVLGGLDQLVHGGNSMRGWGSPATPDPVLLVPRGFDAASSAFRYDVNPRFADTRPGRSLLLNPFRIVVDFSFNLSTDFDLQQLRRAVEPVRSPAGGWARRSADSLAAFYLSRTSSLHKLVLEQSDSLFLSRAQIAALRHADSVYSARVRALYIPLGQFLAQGQGGAGKAELDSVQATQKEYWKVFWRQPEIADSIVTPSQKELLPLLKGIVAIPQQDREHSQWQFGRPVTFSDQAPAKPSPPVGGMTNRTGGPMPPASER